VAVRFGYYDDGYSGYFDPSTVAPDEQPAYPARGLPLREAAAFALQHGDLQGPSEASGEASVTVVGC
jgi:hypothetical protein